MSGARESLESPGSEENDVSEAGQLPAGQTVPPRRYAVIYFFLKFVQPVSQFSVPKAPI